MDMRVLYSVPSDYPLLWERWTRRLRGPGSVRRRRVLGVADKVLVALFALLYLLIGWNLSLVALIAYVGSTALCFAFMSFWRHLRNAPRPYESFALKPLVPAEGLKAGNSLPSRHTFSAFLIATMATATLFPWGGLALPAAAVVGCIRVMEGVHFPRDAMAGALAGIAAGVLCTGCLLAVAL